MSPELHLLVREVGLVAVGVACSVGVQRFTPLTADVKGPFVGIIFLATLVAMAKVAGIL